MERWWSRGQAELLQPHLPQLSVSSALKEFDAIQKEQKENSSCTDKREWWTGRLELDRRMEVCVPSVGWDPACPRDGGACLSQGSQVLAEPPQVLSGSVGLNKKLCHLGSTLNKSLRLEGVMAMECLKVSTKKEVKPKYQPPDHSFHFTSWL